MYRIMEVCNVINNNSKVKDEPLDSVSDEYTATNDPLQLSDSLEPVERNKSDESRIDEVPNNDTNACQRTNKVPLNHDKSEADFITKSVCKRYNECDDKAYIAPVSSHGVEESSLSKEVISLNKNTSMAINLGSSVCEDSDSHSDFLSTVSGSTEKTLLELTETCDLRSVGHNSCVDIECERGTFLKRSSSNNNICESATTPTLTTFDTSSLCDVLSVKNEQEIVCKDEICDESDALESKEWNEQDDDDDPLKNTIPKLSSQDPCGQPLLVAGNREDSDTISYDGTEERDVKLEMMQNRDIEEEEPDLTCKMDNQNQIPSNDVLPSKLKFVSGPVLYQCIYCSFTDRQLEKLSPHVLCCVKKRKLEEDRRELENQRQLDRRMQLEGEPPLKFHASSNDQHTILPKCQLSIVSKIQPISSQAEVSATPKTQLIIGTPQPQLLASPHAQLSSSPKTQLINAPEAQFMMSPQAQLTGATKTVFSIAPKLVPIPHPQILINSQTRLPVSSQQQVLFTTRREQKSVLKPQIKSQAQMFSSSKVQPVVTLQTQFPIVSTTHFTSASKPQGVTSTQGQFSLAAGTKLTLGPHSQVPIVPQTPLTLSPQGLTIAQAGTQLLITTKPVQQNAGTSNQPTLLGLGIGTNPAVAPKNIVLLPNVLLNSVSPTGNINGKQSPASIQGQFILQTAGTTPCSVTPLQFQQNLVQTSRSLLSQPQVLLSSACPIPNKSVSTSVIKTAPSAVRKSKLTFTPSVRKLTLNSNTAPTSTTNSKPVELPGQTRSLDKFICEICDDYVKDLEKLRQHMQCLHAINIHPKMMPSFNCQKCQFCFFTEQGLERHLVGSHGLVTTGMQEAADKGKDGGRCPICGWGYQSKLLHHVATDHKVCLKPADLSYKCTLCTATFGVYKKFEDHVYSAHRPAISKLAQGNPQSSSPAIK